MFIPKTLQEAIQHFTDEDTCIQTVVEMRWPHGVICPACEHKDLWYLKAQRRWKCKECHRQFSVKLGTIFEESPVPLSKWLAAMWMLANCKNGVSSYEVGRDLGVTQKSAWFMLHRIRLAMSSGSLEKMSGECEADETYVGGSLRNMHKSRRKLFMEQRGSVGKTAVMGILERGTGKVRAKVVADTKRKTLQAEVREHIALGSALMTDEAAAYQGLHGDYVHEVVNHLQSYVRGKVHTNGLENFWSLLKRGLDGTYVSVEPFHLDRYVDEQVFRYNNRKDKKDGDRFALLLSQIAGKRLTFAEVTGKVGTTPR